MPHLRRRIRLPRLDLLGILAAILFLAMIGGTGAFLVLALGPDPGLSPRPSAATAVGPSPAPSGAGPAASPPASAPVPSGAPPSAGASGEPPADGSVPIVPVVDFWSARLQVSREQMVRALEGRRNDFQGVAVTDDDAAALGVLLNVSVAPESRVATPAQVVEAVAGGALGFLRASDVTPGVRALQIGETGIFGTDRVRSSDEWPLVVHAEPADATQWSQANVWTLVAAGEILLDRGVARQVTERGRGIDFPFDGGRVSITRRVCCSEQGERVPDPVRAGGAGAVRQLVEDADLAVAVLESPVDDEFEYHPRGETFTADPALVRGIANVGVDLLSLATDHVRDAGADGVAESVAAITELGMVPLGAGADRRAAAAPAVRDVGGVRVAVLACDGTRQSSWASNQRPGAQRCAGAGLVEATEAAATTAEVVVILPHWGTPDAAVATSRQRAWARSWIRAGADLVIGSGPHGPGAVEQINGGLVFYSLGTFVYDDDSSEAAMEGLVLELTFHGAHLAQVAIHPTFIVDGAQPNLLVAAGGGDEVLERIRDGSRGLGSAGGAP